jgi:hypothetical protein
MKKPELIPVTSKARLSISLFGANAKPLDLLVVGGVVGAVAGIGPMFEFQPVLVFFPFAWFLYTMSRVFPFLSNPRRDAAPFALGVSYALRLELSTTFALRKGAELTAIGFLASVAFCLLRGILYHNFAFGETILMTAVIFGEVIPLFGALVCAIRLPIIRPSKRDEHPFRFFSPGSSLFAKQTASFFMHTAQSVSRLFTGEARIIAKRIVLYLFRGDIAGLTFFTAAGLIISLLITALFRDNQGFLSGLILLVGPIALLTAMTETMSESALRLHLCSYYSFKEKTVITVYFAFASVATLPFVFMYAVKMLCLEGPVHVPSLLRIAAYILSCAALSLSLSLRWASCAWTSVSISGFALTVLCALVGLAIPLYGPLLPLFALLLVLFLGK